MYSCRHCGEDAGLLTIWDDEPPWKRTIQRLKDGISLNAPFDEKETREQEEWDGYV